MPARPGAKPGSTPKRNTPPLPHIMQLRLTEAQRRYLLYLSARQEVNMAEVVRRMIDRSLDAQPRVHAEGEGELPEEVRGQGMSLRSLLGMVTEDGISDLVQQAERRA